MREITKNTVTLLLFNVKPIDQAHLCHQNKSMKIFITASKSAYPQVEQIKNELEQAGHTVTPPNGYGDPHEEEVVRQYTPEEYSAWKADMIRQDGQIVAAHDAVLAINIEKNGQKDYIGGATFLELFKAFDLGKKIYLYNPIPDNMLRDEIIGFQPIVLHGDLSLLR